MFTFADTYRGKYSDSISDASQFYNSSGYLDELCEAASLLFKATGDNNYLIKAKSFFNINSVSMWGQSWDERWMSSAILLYDITHDDAYLSKVNNHI